MVKSSDVEIRVGRRATDGIVKLSPIPPELLQLSVSYKGERSASVVLTREQVQVLKQSLTQFENEMQPARQPSEIWDHQERRLEQAKPLPDSD
jgi:hypothetical protein